MTASRRAQWVCCRALAASGWVLANMRMTRGVECGIFGAAESASRAQPSRRPSGLPLKTLDGGTRARPPTSPDRCPFSRTFVVFNRPIHEPRASSTPLLCWPSAAQRIAASNPVVTPARPDLALLRRPAHCSPTSYGCLRHTALPSANLCFDPSAARLAWCFSPLPLNPATCLARTTVRPAIHRIPTRQAALGVATRPPVHPSYIAPLEAGL